MLGNAKKIGWIIKRTMTKIENVQFVTLFDGFNCQRVLFILSS